MLQYDDLAGAPPPLLGNSGNDMTSPYQGLVYGAKQWNVVDVNAGLIQTLNANSAPNVLSTQAVAPGTRAGRISKVTSSDGWDADHIFVGCAIEQLSEVVPVSCTVTLDIGTYSLAGNKQRQVQYDGSSNQLAKADLSVEDIRSIGFVVSSADDFNVPTSILIDNFAYTITPNGHSS